MLCRTAFGWSSVRGIALLGQQPSEPNFHLFWRVTRSDCGLTNESLASAPAHCLCAQRRRVNRCMRTPGCSLSKYILVLSVVLPVAGCGGVKAGSSSTQQVSIQLNQATATLAPGATQQFTATVSGSDNTAVTWTVDKVGGGNSTVGTITSTGLYTAPQASGTHVVTATAVADTTKSASATVTVKGTLAISPATSTVFPGATQQFQAT